MSLTDRQYTPLKSGRIGDGVGILVNNAIKLTFRRIYENPLIMSLASEGADVATSVNMMLHSSLIR